MTQWSGHAEFRSDDGDLVLEGHVTFSSQRNAAGLGSWQGAMAITGVAPDVHGGTLTVRLPSGAEGQVLVRNSTVNASGGRVTTAIQFLGTGPAPF
jgi:hypothetical protein